MVIGETHLRDSVEGKCMHTLLTTSDYAGWQVMAAHAPGGQHDCSGLLVWYNTATVTVTEPAELELGRVASMRVAPVACPEAAFRLVAAYRVAAAGQRAQARRRTNAAIECAVESAVRRGEEVAVMGDLQVQTRAAAEAFGGDFDAEDAWLEEQLLDMYGMRSMGDVEATYFATSKGGVRTQSVIDHAIDDIEYTMYRYPDRIGSFHDSAQQAHVSIVPPTQHPTWFICRSERRWQVVRIALHATCASALHGPARLLCFRSCGPSRLPSEASRGTLGGFGRGPLQVHGCAAREQHWRQVPSGGPEALHNAGSGGT